MIPADMVPNVSMQRKKLPAICDDITLMFYKFNHFAYLIFIGAGVKSGKELYYRKC